MGKKTKKDQTNIRYNLDLQMNLLAEIATRNPGIKALLENHAPKFPKDQYDRLYKETYGEIFARFPFPVFPLNNLRKTTSELVLSIDLNYTKDEIMFVLEKTIDLELAKYRKKHELKIKRKYPQKWIDYL